MPVRKRKRVEVNDGSYGGKVLAAFDRMASLPYRAETNGTYMECIHCGGSVESWDVVGPDDRAVSTGSKEEDARELAEMLNEAFGKGKNTRTE